MKPRCIRPGRTWFITRRTTRKSFLLRPDADGTCQQIYWYTTAVLAQKFGIVIHAVQVLSTHIHEVLTDTRGNLPAFIRERNRAIANALKRHRGWSEEVFQRAPASYVELYGPHAIAKEIGYTLANCVEAGLVSSPAQWPGVTSQVSDMGSTTIEVERPSIYFDPENPVWPERASLRLEIPQEVSDTMGTRALEFIGDYVDRAVERARALAKEAGKSVGNIARLMTTPWTRQSQSPDPAHARNPTFATGGDPEQRRRALSDRRTFLDTYRAALDAWRRGIGRPAFPEGAWRWCRELLPPRDPTSQVSMSVTSHEPRNHSTVTVFARFLGWSTSVPLRSAMWYARS